VSHGTQVHFNKPANILVPEGRKLRGSIDALAASLKDVGLINPITITPERVLIAGLHRLKAWEAAFQDAPIPCLVTKLDAVRAEIAEIDENSLRHNEPVLERGQKQARRKVLYEALHPQTKNGGDRKSDQNVTRDVLIPTYAEDAAKRRGVKPREIQREVQIAEDIDPEAQDDLAGTPVANSKRQLLEIARESKQKQKEIAAALKSGKAKTVKEAKGAKSTKADDPLCPEARAEADAIKAYVEPLIKALAALEAAASTFGALHVRTISPETTGHGLMVAHARLVELLGLGEVEKGTGKASDVRWAAKTFIDLRRSLKSLMPIAACGNCSGSRACPGESCAYEGWAADAKHCPGGVCGWCTGQGYIAAETNWKNHGFMGENKPATGAAL